MRKKIIYLIFFIFLNTVLLSLNDGISCSREYNFNIIQTFNSDDKILEFEQIDTYVYNTEKSLKIKAFTFSENYNEKLIHTSYLINSRFVYPSQKYVELHDDESFQSDVKIHTVIIPKEPKIGMTFVIKKTYNYTSFDFEPLIIINRDPSLTNIKISFDLSKNIKVNPRYFSFDKTFDYKESFEKKKLTINMDSLHISETKDYVNFKNIYAMIQLEIELDGKIYNSLDIKDFVKLYNQKSKYQEDTFKAFLFLCQQEYNITNFAYNLNPDSLKISLPMIEELKLKIKTINRSRLKELDNFLKSQNNVSDPTLKIKNIYAYVQNNYRYIAKEDSTNNIFAHDPVDIIKNAYGDCKDFSTLIKALAKHSGIDLDLALVSTHNIVKENFVNSYLFNHMIAVYTKDNHPFFLDATDKYNNFGEIPGSLFGKSYFLLNENNSKLAYFPNKTDKANLSIKIKADLNNLSQTRFEVLVRNSNRKLIQSLLENSDSLTIENFLSNMLNSEFVNIHFKNINIKSKNDSLFILEGISDLSRFFIESKNRIYARKQCFSDYNNLSSRDQDSLSFLISLYDFIELDITFLSPLNISGDPLSYSFEDNLIKAEIHKDSDLNSLHYSSIVIPDVYENERKLAILNFFKFYNSKKNDMFIINKGE